MFSIGELSRQAGVKISTIRYYESIELLQQPARSEGNQRRYVDADLQQLEFIKHARKLGFSIDAIRALLRLSHHPEQQCVDADLIAVEQLESVRTSIKRLQKLEKELERISACCQGDNIETCYVIQALADHKLCESEH